jgi:hypothetical protein
MRGRLEFVVLAGIDHQLGLAAQTFQRLIHLLAAKDRDILVNVAAHE